MYILKQQDFWQWLFSFEKKSFSPKIFEELKNICTINNEHVEINCPINSRFSFSILSDCEFDEEFLYLKIAEDYYLLGWFDCHNHEDVFKFDEFYHIMGIIKQKQNVMLYQTSFLLLSRYVVLTNEFDAKQLMQHCLDILENLCCIDGSNMSYNITKHQWYGRRILDQTFLWKFIKNHQYQISFNIK